MSVMILRQENPLLQNVSSACNLDRSGVPNSISCGASAISRCRGLIGFRGDGVAEISRR